MSNIFCPFCGGDQRTGEIAMRLGHRPDIAFARLARLEKATKRLIAAVRQAGDISTWPVCGEGDVVGDELAAALKEAEDVLR